ncbi:rhodanese-like domain-containing protein [Kitasatospora camelliae]|uniref:Rhodanese-like domain-containing protein n=1 Tax=Kitasatospora camelliae TaxID=3156397 RepID=A0AAU8JSR2_9ACTN
MPTLPTYHDPADPSQTTPAAAERLLVTGRATLLDVREEDEFCAGRAPSARWLPLGDLAAGAGLPAGIAGHPDHPVLVVCRSGSRSGQAVALLTARGVTARNVAGGMRAWARAGLPLVTADGTVGQVI